MENVQEKIKVFAALIQKETLERLNKQNQVDHKLPEDFWVVHAATNIKPGRKYTKVDQNGSGKYMIVNETGEIFGIKGYGVIHRGHQYGTLDTVDLWYWGEFRGYKRLKAPAAPGMAILPEPEPERIIKVGLKNNANFLFGQMQGDTLGGSTGEPLYASILHLTEKQFDKFKALIETFGGDLEKSLTKSTSDDADYVCYFTKTEPEPETTHTIEFSKTELKVILSALDYLHNDVDDEEIRLLVSKHIGYASYQAVSTFMLKLTGKIKL